MHGSLRMAGALVLACAGWQARPLYSQEPPPEADAAPADEAPAATSNKAPQTVRLHLMDGSIVTGTLSIDALPVETDFGALSVPIDRLKSFTPGLGSHPELGQRVEQWIEDLGAGNFDQREAAQKELRKIGLPVRPRLERRQDDPDNERRNRIKAILAEFDEIEASADEFDEDAASFDQEALIERDTIETTQFTIVGNIVPQSFTVASPYGRLEIQLGDIRRCERDLDIEEPVRKTIAVDGNYVVPRGMKTTSIRLERGDRVTIVASGTITMTPWGQAVSTPEGAPNFGWYVEGQIPGGALVAAIGDEGEVFKIGNRLTFTAERAGTLQLGIAMQAEYAQQGFPGQYKARILVRPHP